MKYSDIFLERVDDVGNISKLAPKKNGFIWNKIENGLARIDVVYESPVSQERAGTRGISHLIEHIVCDSVKDREVEYKRKCITNNAFTSAHVVSFHQTGLKADIDSEVVNYVSSIINAPIKKEVLEKERSIVGREFDMYMSDSSVSLEEMLHQIRYGRGHVIGIKEDIQKISLEEIQSFYDQAFNKPAYIVYTCADEPPKELVEMCEKLEYETDIQLEENTYPLVHYRSDSSGLNSIHYRSIATLDTTSMEDCYYLPIINACLGSGLESPLMMKLREEKGLTYGARAGQSMEVDLNSATIRIDLTSGVDNRSVIMDTIADILNNFEQYVSQERFETIISSFKRGQEISLHGTPSFGHVAKHTTAGVDKVNLSDKLETVSYEGMVEFYNKNIKDLEFTMWDDLTIEKYVNEKFEEAKKENEVSTENFDEFANNDLIGEHGATMVGYDIILNHVWR